MSQEIKIFKQKPYIEEVVFHETKKGRRPYIVKRFLKEKRCENCRIKYFSKRNESRFCSKKCVLWKGGITHRSNGYVWIKDWNHPSANNQGYVYLHRYVVEKSIGRTLEKWEVVHHKDGNKKNNDINNLVIMSEAEHSRMHLKARNYHRKYIKTKFHHINSSKCAHWKELI